MVSQLGLDLDGANWKIGMWSELSPDLDRPSGKTGDTVRIEP